MQSYLRWSLAVIAACMLAHTALAEGRATSADPVLVGAGDISSCKNDHDEATAKLLDRIVAAHPQAHVFTLGDNVYPAGTIQEFAQCYAPTWGRHKKRTAPTIGNHEYATAHATGYFAYFGAAAGDSTKGYYSYNLGRWHIIVLNSNCNHVGGCDAHSPQWEWLAHDLTASHTKCTLALWHHPRFSSGLFHGSDKRMGPFWELLYQHDVEVVLNGHEHSYERFSPQTPAAKADPVHGIREFVVGTGGATLYPFGLTAANSEIRQSRMYGVLQLTLHPTSYEWDYLPVAGKKFPDHGFTACH